MKPLSNFISHVYDKESYFVNAKYAVEQKKALLELKDQTQHFIRFALVNRSNDCVKFSLVCTNSPKSFVQMYSDNCLRNITLPNKPHKPAVSDIVTSTSIALMCSWNVLTEHMHDNTCHGIVSYCASTAQQGGWVSQGASIDANRVTVNHLKPCTSYIFKLATQYPYGRSEDSDVSEPITTHTLPSPEKPEIQRVGDKTSIKIEWTEPYEYGGLIDGYIVKYKPRARTKADWKVVTTVDASVIVNLSKSPGNVYVCEIVAKGEFGQSEACIFQFDSNTRVGKYKVLHYRFIGFSNF